MDVGTVQNPAVTIAMPGQKAGTPSPAPEAKVATPVEIMQAQEPKIKVASEADSEKIDKENKTVTDTVVALNQFMDLMTADLHFQIHQKTNRLMVQLVSEKDQKVLREYPSKDFLDMIANIREHIGVLTDKKA